MNTVGNIKGARCCISIQGFMKQVARQFITNCNGVHHLYAFSGLRIKLVVFSIEEMQVE